VCVRSPGDVPAEDPDHRAVLRVHAGPPAGRLPVALPAQPHGRRGSGPGTDLRFHRGLGYYGGEGVAMELLGQISHDARVELALAARMIHSPPNGSSSAFDPDQTRSGLGNMT